MFHYLITFAIGVLAGGAGGYLWGAKVKATAEANANKVATAAKDIAAEVKKL